MTTRKLEREEWKPYFDRVTKVLMHEKQPVYTEVRVMTPALGAQTETEWTPLIGITYDQRESRLEIATDPVDHMVTALDEIYVIEDGKGLPTILEVLGNGTKQVIELRY